MFFSFFVYYAVFRFCLLCTILVLLRFLILLLTEQKVCALLDDLEIDYVVDPNLVRGLDYYSHTVFEIISDDPKLGAGSTVGGGGRYNGLVEELGGPQTWCWLCFWNGKINDCFR